MQPELDKSWSQRADNEIHLLLLLLYCLKYIMDLNMIRSVPSWLSWLERQSHNLKVVSSSLTEGKNFF